MDHKPLTFAIQITADTYTNQQSRWLLFITEFTTDIVFFYGNTNDVADTFSSIKENKFLTSLDYTKSWSKVKFRTSGVI